MKLGVVFPQTAIGADPGAIREYVQAAEELGYSHLVAYDHVLGADPAKHSGWEGGYTYRDLFHEPFVLFGYLAAITQRLELMTGIVILPQRQTALVAKQTAEIDVLSGGRLRLGIGLGWNQVEYEALGEDFHNRGRRCEEQIALLRALWTQDAISFQGRWHRVTGAGINPLPVQRPIPIWIGGRAEQVLRRIARLGDGWFPLFRPDEDARQVIGKLHEYTREAGRDPASIGIEGRVNFASQSEEAWATDTKRWRDLGATHLNVNTMGAGLNSPQQHIEAIRRYKAVADRVD